MGINNGSNRYAPSPIKQFAFLNEPEYLRITGLNES